MRKFFYLTILALAFVACKRNIEENKIKFTAFVSDETCPVNPQDTVGGGCLVGIRLLYPVAFADTAVLRNIQQEIIAQMFGDEYVGSTPQKIIGEFVNSERENWQFAHDDFASALDRAKRDVLLSFNTTLSSDIRFNKGGVLAYEISKSMYEGGVHGLAGRNFLLFNLKTGNLMTEEDVFKGDYNQVLSAAFVKNLRELALSDNSDSDLADNDFDDIFPNGNFYADDEGITYLFHKDEIVAFDLDDDIEIFIPYKDIKAILRRDSPIAVFF